jgi:hypothetical protein
VRLLHIVAGEPPNIFIDADGETITREAAVLHLNIVFMPHGTVRTSWMWARRLEGNANG